MLLSMTGHGEAQLRDGDRVATVEVRSVNHRYFKLVARLGDGQALMESRLESVVRQYIRRGSVHVGVRLDRPAAELYQLDIDLLRRYRQQLIDLSGDSDDPMAVPWTALLGLPGVVADEAPSASISDADWTLVESALRESLEHLQRMRRQEGQAMLADLEQNCEEIAAGIEQISVLAPQVAESYRSRLTERLNRILSEHQLQVEPGDLVREVGTFAERSDISEELVRLSSHVEQFRAIMSKPESSGRKMEFVTQEMFREANTIGSKANDSSISGHVIEVKAAIERMREMIQNIE